MLNNSIRGGYSESINMLRFPLAILVVFVHCFGADIDVSELHASGLTGLALYPTVLFGSNSQKCSAHFLYHIRLSPVPEGRRI